MKTSAYRNGFRAWHACAVLMLGSATVCAAGADNAEAPPSAIPETSAASGRIAAIMDDARTPSARQKTALLLQLPRTLAGDERKKLLDYACGPCPPGMEPRYWHWVNNDALHALCRQSRPMDEMAEPLLALLAGESRDLAIRDYAMQHMALLCAPGTPDDAWIESARLRASLYAALVREASQPRSPLAATALNCLCVLREAKATHPELKDRMFTMPAGVLEKLVIATVRAEDAGANARMASLAICGQLGLAEILPDARGIIADAKQPPMVMSAAIGCLGKLGNASDLALLEGHRQSDDLRLRNAARAALKALERRFPSGKKET
jgi:hypothetical protein